MKAGSTKVFLVIKQVARVVEQADRLLATGVGKDLGLPEDAGEEWDKLSDLMADLHLMLG